MSEKQQKPESLQKARQEARRRRRRQLMIKRNALLGGVVLAALLVVGACVTGVVLTVVGTQQSQRGETTDFMAVEKIIVEGDSRYSEKEIIKASGLYVGQSLFGVNKVQAHDKLKKALPYLETVEIGNKGILTLHIKVTDATVMGAVEIPDGWVIVSDNNRALEVITEGEPPEGTLRLTGTGAKKVKVGQSVLDERSLNICQMLVEAEKQYGLKGMTRIDVTEKTKIFLMLNNRLKVLLGNESNIYEQMDMLVDTLPVFYENNGINAEGLMDMTSFIDEDTGNDRVVYTPPELLEEEPEPEKEPEKTDKTDKTEPSKKPED